MSENLFAQELVKVGIGLVTGTIGGSFFLWLVVGSMIGDRGFATYRKCLWCAFAMTIVSTVLWGVAAGLRFVSPLLGGLLGLGVAIVGTWKASVAILEGVFEFEPGKGTQAMIFYYLVQIAFAVVLVLALGLDASKLSAVRTGGGSGYEPPDPLVYYSKISMLVYEGIPEEGVTYDTQKNEIVIVELNSNEFIRYDMREAWEQKMREEDVAAQLLQRMRTQFVKTFGGAGAASAPASAPPAAAPPAPPAAIPGTAPSIPPPSIPSAGVAPAGDPFARSSSGSSSAGAPSSGSDPFANPGRPATAPSMPASGPAPSGDPFATSSSGATRPTTGGTTGDPFASSSAPAAGGAPPSTPAASAGSAPASGVAAAEVASAESLISKARAKWDEKAYDASILLAERALEIYRKHLPASDPRIAQVEGMISAAEKAGREAK